MANNKTTIKPKRPAPGENLPHDLISAYNPDPITADSLRTDLNSMQTTARNMLSDSAKVGTYLKDVKSFKDNLTDEEFTTLTESAGVLVKDLLQYKNKLDEIAVEQQQLPWDSKDIMDIQYPSFSIYEKYHEWILSYSTVVLPEIATIQALMRLAATNKAAN